MSDGGKEAVRVDNQVVNASEVKTLKRKICELERLLGKKTMEVDNRPGRRQRKNLRAKAAWNMRMRTMQHPFSHLTDGH